MELSLISATSGVDNSKLNVLSSVLVMRVSLRKLEVLPTEQRSLGSLWSLFTVPRLAVLF